MHRLLLSHLDPDSDGRVMVTGDEAHHALRVKRLVVGDAVEALDGRGRVLTAEVAGATTPGSGKGRSIPSLVLRVLTDRLVERPEPEVEVWTAPPKGDRLAPMIDALSQVGAASWGPLRSARTVVEPREGKLGRLERVAAESAKQCGRAWMLDIAPGGGLADALRAPSASIVLADASGEPYKAAGADQVRLLVGPEGGWTTGELAQARGAGARVARFGSYVMRIETAAVVAAAMVVTAQGR